MITVIMVLLSIIVPTVLIVLTVKMIKELNDFKNEIKKDDQFFILVFCRRISWSNNNYFNKYKYRGEINMARLIIHAISLVSSIGLCVAGIITATVFPTVLGVFTLASSVVSFVDAIRK